MNCEQSNCRNLGEVELELWATGEPVRRQVVCTDHAASASLYLPMLARTVRAAGPYLVRLAWVR